MIAAAVHANRRPMNSVAGYHPKGTTAAAATKAGGLNGADIVPIRQMPLQPVANITSDPKPVTGFAARFPRIIGTLYRGLPSYPNGPGTSNRNTPQRQKAAVPVGEPVRIAAAAQLVPATPNAPFWRALDRR